MKFQYSIKWESYLTQEVVDEMVGPYYIINYIKSRDGRSKVIRLSLLPLLRRLQ